jgi:multiple sugar transport system substrate-binding protein
MGISLLIGAVALSGCSSKNDNASQEPAASGKPPEKVELRMLWWGSQDRHDLTMKAIKLFEDKNPNIKVTPEYSGFDGYWDKLSVQVGGGSAPDVIQMSTAYINDYVNRQSLLLLDGTSIKLTDIDESTLSTGKLNGKLYAIPAGISSTALVYDPAMLTKAGVKLPELMTWDELTSATKQISEKLGKDVFGITNESGTPEMLQHFIRQKGAEFFKEGKIGFTADMLTEYFKYWEKLRNDGLTSTPEQTASYFGAPLEKYPIITGKTPFALLSSNQIGSMSTLANRPLEMTFIPKTSGGQDADYLSPSMYWSIYAKTKYPKESAMLADFLLNDPEAGKILGANRGVPVSSKIREALKPQLNEIDKKQFDFVDKVAKISKPINVIDPKGAGEVRQLLGTTAQEIQFGKKSPEQGAKDFIEKGNAILEKMK